jgi:hypothetical protein
VADGTVGVDDVIGVLVDFSIVGASVTIILFIIELQVSVVDCIAIYNRKIRFP